MRWGSGMAALHTASREIRLVKSWNIFHDWRFKGIVSLDSLTRSLKRLWRAPCAGAVSFVVKALHESELPDPFRNRMVRENRPVRPSVDDCEITNCGSRPNLPPTFRIRNSYRSLNMAIRLLVSCQLTEHRHLLG